MSDFMIGAQSMPTYVERDINELHEWEDNPRNFKESDLDRLEEQIKLLGVYKPFLINQDNIVLGGHRRLAVLKRMGVERVSCSLVRTDNKAQMMDYALSDNDQIGTTDEARVVAYVAKYADVNTKLFAINSQPMKLVSSVLEALKPQQQQDKAISATFVVRIAFKDKEAMENALVEIQEVCERYSDSVKGISVNDGN